MLVALPVVRVQMEAGAARKVLLHQSFCRKSIVNRIVRAGIRCKAELRGAINTGAYTSMADIIT
jgi:hypothetical protein